ncbi:MAG: sarcosine oxidase subunit alpha, partial [Bauldia sp.]|nr:sarcosine oxidase subunit alpha [Bauldia sp.]
IVYGTEALGVMRIEKGHVAGPELDGNTTAGDLGLGGMMSKKKDFVGRVLAGREALTASDRRVLVGIRPVDASQRLRSGAHIFPANAAIGPDTDQGHVTSACFSPTREQWIGLGLVRQGRDRIGEVALAHDPLRGEDYEVELCSPKFYDPDGARQHG